MTRGAGDRGRTADGVGDAQAMRDNSNRVRTARRWATGAALLLIVGACSGDDDGSATTTTVDSAARQAPDGEYELTTSGVPARRGGGLRRQVPTTDRVRCLTLVVPESRGVAGAESERLVRLPVVIVAAQEPSDRASPTRCSGSTMARVTGSSPRGRATSPTRRTGSTATVT